MALRHARRTSFALLPSANCVSPPTAIITSSTVISSRYGSDCGAAASPMTRTWVEYTPWNPSTITVTRGSLT